MNLERIFSVFFLSSALAILCGLRVVSAATVEPNGDLLAIQHEWASANYSTDGKKERRAAFDALVEHAAAVAEKYPSDVDVVAWEGIVLSTYAGEVSAMGAMKVAKAALERLQRAEAMNAEALSGGVYASLGALYSKVPGGFVGFGDDELAEQYFIKALAVDADNIDNNYFYGEYLLEHGRYAEALDKFEHALNSPTVAGRPVFDAGRRTEIRNLMDEAQSAIR